MAKVIALTICKLKECVYTEEQILGSQIIITYSLKKGTQKFEQKGEELAKKKK